MNDRARTPALLLCVATGLLALVAAPARPDTDPGLLDLAKAGMLDRYQSIKSFRGSVQQVTLMRGSDGERRAEAKVTGAFDGLRLRLSVEGTVGSDVKYEGAFDGANTTEWMKSASAGLYPVRIYGGLKGLTKSAFDTVLDPRGHGIWIVGSGVTGLGVIGKEMLNGSECIVLQDDSSSTADYRVKSKTWVDAEHGFTIPRSETEVISRTTGQVVARQEYVTRIRDYGNGMWGPAQFTMTQYGADGSLTKSTTLTYGPDFQINVSIDGRDLALNVPSGVGVDNEVVGATYTLP